MQRGSTLEFACKKCKNPLSFSLFDVDYKHSIVCDQCKKDYQFDDENLVRQLKKFSALCCQIRESEEILSNASIGVDIADKSIKIPFKLLLTRLNSCLEVMLGDEPLTLTFRLEPLKDSPK